MTAKPTGMWDFLPEIDALWSRLPALESRAESHYRRRKIIDALMYFADPDPDWGKLGSCRNATSCNSAICPVCVRRLRSSLILSGLACIDPLMKELQWEAAEFSVYLPDAHYRVGRLDGIDVPSIKAQLECLLELAGVPLGLVGANIMLFDERSSKKRGVWKVQVSGVLVGVSASHIESKFQALFAPRTWTASPLRSLDLAEALGRLIKPGLTRFVTCINREGHRRVRERQLQAAQISEMAACLGRYELSVRYSLTGCRWHNGRLELTPGVEEQLQNLAPTQIR